MKLAQVMKRYINRPFVEYGCLELVVSVLRDLGRELPPEVDGINLDNYHDLVAQNIRVAQVAMLRIFRKIGRSSNAKYPHIADLLVVLQKTRGGLFPAVYVGNGMALASFSRKGVCVFELNQYNLAVLARTVT